MDQLGGAIAVIDILQLSKDDPALEKLGFVTSVAVFADAENLVHPVGAEIFRKMSVGGAFSLVGILASSGASIPLGSARNALKNAFSGPCITISAENELQALRTLGDFTDIQGEVVHLTGSSPQITSTSVPTDPINHDSLDFDHIYVNELGNNVERNERLLEILQIESKGMSPGLLRKSLQFGNGSRLDKAQQKGIGKFGMGLPNSSISQCKRVDVWTWQDGVVHHAYLDVQDIQEGKMIEIPEPQPSEIPSEWLSLIAGNLEEHPHFA